MTEPAAVQGAEGLRVLELGERLSGAYAGLILAAQGAIVHQVRAGLDRRLDEVERAYFDRGRLVAGADDVASLARNVDVVLTDLPIDRLEAFGLPTTGEEVERRVPGSVQVSVTSLGLHGPHARFEMEDICEWASGGLAYVSRRAVPLSDTERYTPVLAPGRQPELLGGIAAATGVLCGVRQARATGRAVLVDVSRQEVQTAMLHNVIPPFVWSHKVVGGPGGRLAIGMLVPAADGDVYFRTLEPHQWDALVEWMGSPDWARPLDDGTPIWLADPEAVATLMSEWTSRHRRQWLLEEGQRRRIPVALPRRIPEVLSSGHLQARGFWDVVDVGGVERRAPRVPMLDPGDRGWKPGEPASGPVAEGRVAEGPAAEGPAATELGPEDGGPGPLEGIRVLDLGWSWAAPYAGMILADLGAEVIKVESSRRIDVLRWSSFFADGVRHHERSGYFGACNRGKLSVTLDLKDPRGRELLLGLVDRCDVVLENFAPRVLTALGIGPDVVTARNPAVVMVSLSGYGASGPERDYLSYGDHLLHASGFASVTGSEDDPHTKLGTFYGDTVGGMYAALAVLAGIAARARTGRGGWFELSQLEGLVSMLPSTVIRESGGEHVGRSVDKVPTMCPHGFYRCLGEDPWVAIAVADDARWSRLQAVLAADGIEVAGPGVAGVGLDRLAARKAHEPLVDQAVARWTSTRSPWEVTRACQRAGVAAYPVQSAPNLLWDDHLAERRHFAWVHRPITGPAPLPGVVFRVSGDGARVRGYAPLLGEHNEQVLVGLCGLDRAEYEVLVADGVIG